MTLGSQEIARAAEMEGGGLSGPANSLTEESIDCGCGRYKLPGLAKFATRRIFLALLCSIGLLQASAQTYFNATSSAIARKFGLDPRLLEWIQCVSGITPVFFGIVIAYWGDRFHRMSWLGGLALIQCASFIALIIPHCVDDNVSDENSTGVSISTGESSDLCTETPRRVVGSEDSAHYSTLFILIVTQIVAGMAHVAFYSLGVSYLDDNTKRARAPICIGLLLAATFLGRVFGYALGWGALRIDAEGPRSEASPLGASWLGWPVYGISLAVPASLIAVFPRKLPSEMVEQAAATILDQSGALRAAQRTLVKTVGSPNFLPSMWRLSTNDVHIFNVLATVFGATAISNFIDNENLFLESRFYAAQPLGAHLGFGDPLTSRILSTIMRPILIGLSIICASFVIAYCKPKSRTLVAYSLAVWLTAALIIFCLAFLNCSKAPIIGTHKESIQLLQYCNKNCQCSQDADFYPVCDMSGKFIFYSPCHAGCSSIKYENNTKIYTNCSCVEYNVGSGNTEAKDGPCGFDNCRVGWISYEVLTTLVYTMIGSTIIGDLLISLRSINTVDKALAIGYGMSLLGLFVYVIGKIPYDKFVETTCKYWGHNDHKCHLHHSKYLANYLCFVTSGLIIIGIVFKIGVWFFSKDLDIYDSIKSETKQLTEMKDISKTQAEPLLQSQSTSSKDNTQNDRINDGITESPIEPVIILENENNGINPLTSDENAEENDSSSRLKYGPVGPGDRRSTKNRSNTSIVNVGTDEELESSDGSQFPGKTSLSQVSYKPLEIDSDVESNLSGTEPRSRKCIPSSEFDVRNKMLHDNYLSLNKMGYATPENYEDTIKCISHENVAPFAMGVLSKSNSIENINKLKNNVHLSTSRGNFNEVGIPVIESYASLKGSTSSLRSPTIKTSLQYLNKNPDLNLLEETQFVSDSSKNNDNEEIEEDLNFRLDELMQPLDYPNPAIGPSSHDQGSSGFGSLQDMRDKTKLHGNSSDSRDSVSSKTSVSKLSKKGVPLCTDL